MRLRITVVLLQCFTVADLRIGEVSTTKELIALTDILTVGLCHSTHGYQHEQQGDSTLLRAKERYILQQRVLALQDANLGNDKQQRQDSECHELLVEVAIDGTINLFLRQFVKFSIQLVLSTAIVLYVNESTAASLCYLATHLLIEGRHDGIASIVNHVIASSRNGDRRTLGRTDAQHIDAHASILSRFSSLNRPTLMVFTIGNDDNGLTNLLILCKAVGCHINGGGDVGSLCCHHRRVDVRQEHFGRNIVAGDRQLNEGIASKDDKTNLVVGELINQVLNNHLRTVETTGRNILGQHGVRDIHRNDGLDASTLLVTNLRTHLRTCQHDNQ